MIVCNPTLGMEPNSASGGEVYEREFCRALESVAEVHYHRPPRFRGRPPLIWAAMTRTLLQCEGVLRIHSLRYLGIPAVLSGRPFIAHCHHLEPGPWRPLEKWVLKRADTITVDSVFGMTQVVAAGIWNTTKIHGVPGGVDTRRFFPTMAPASTVRFLGERKWRKNPQFLDALIQRDPHIQAAGPGWPLGPIAEREKPEFYQFAALFLFPSILEGFGLPVLEAMASGVPVIVSTQPALMELVQDGVQGRVLPLDLPLWVQTIKELLNDPATRHNMGEQGRLTASRYSWESAADKWIKAASS